MVLCFCKDRTYVESLPYIDINGTDIERVTQAKIVAKARKVVYVIYQLKRDGINQIDLVRIYVYVIRPVVEYACPVWHTNLSGMAHEHVRYGTRTCPVWHTNFYYGTLEWFHMI